MSKIRIAISGIGAVGGYYGGMLAHHYKDSSTVEIAFISRGENMKAIKEKGLQIKDADNSFRVFPELITDKPEDIGVVNFLLCCTKSYDLSENLSKLNALIDEKTIIVPFLNGADITEQIEELFPDNQVWKGCVYIGSRLIEPGVIHKFSSKERLFFGSETGNKKQQELLLSLLLEAGINAFNPRDITHRIWKKFFMISTAATITSYYDLPINEVMQEHYDKFKTLCTELKMIATAKGIKLADNIIECTLETQKMMPPGSITSMHNDFRQKRNTELDNLTGYVVRQALSLDIDAPCYEMMYKSLATK